MSQPATIACPQCGKAFRWQQQLAGKKVRCLCGYKMLMPQTAPPPAAPPALVPALAATPAATTAAAQVEDDLQLAAPPPPPPRRAQPAAAPAVSAAMTVVHQAAADEDDDDEADDGSIPFSPLWMIYVPAALAIGGQVAAWMLWLQMSPSKGTAILGASIFLAIEILIFVPVGIAAAVATARMLDVGFGQAVPAAIRIAAVTLGPGALADGLVVGLFHFEFDYAYILVGFVIIFFLCGIPLALFFRIGLKEVAMMTAMMAMVRLLVVFGLAASMPTMFGLEPPVA